MTIFARLFTFLFVLAVALLVQAFAPARGRPLMQIGRLNKLSTPYLRSLFAGRHAFLTGAGATLINAFGDWNTRMRAALPGTLTSAGGLAA